ncbi:MAG: HAMP domain-containing histidine kinase [Saprospiraceae bacterium]|nr:HAMP domain-containing histidine kinase [Saprospiraceae bacterium]
MTRYTSLWKNPRIRLILILVSSSFLLLWLLIGFLYYRFAFSKYEANTLIRLQGIANSVASQMDGDLHEKLLQQHPEIDTIQALQEDTIYHKLHVILRNNHQAHMLHSPIYTLVMTDNKKYYEFGATSEIKPYFRNRYSSYHTSLNEQYNNGGIIHMYKDEFGMWLSAFSPLKNRKGETVAVVMVDERFDIFVQSTRNEMLETLLYSGAIFLLMMTGLFWVLKNILSRENRDRYAIEIANDENIVIKDKLMQANQKLSQLDSFRKEMISNISHDLRTPMASIIGFLDLAKNTNSLLSEDDRRNYIDVAYSETKRLNRLVSDLFDLTKLESGQIVLNKEKFNMYELLSDIIQKYQLKINAKHVDLNFEIHENLGLAYGDIKYIDRVFQNLLDNAVRYVDEGGYIKIWILDADKRFKIKICNSGDLIPEADLDVIFDRYYTNEKSDSARSGLGLAIAKSICTLHNCTIKAESNGHVNSFWFTVPKDIR